MTKQPDERKALLFSAVLSLKTPEECENFFCDLCTKTEIGRASCRERV